MIETMEQLAQNSIPSQFYYQGDIFSLLMTQEPGGGIYSVYVYSCKKERLHFVVDTHKEVVSIFYINYNQSKKIYNKDFSKEEQKNFFYDSIS